MEYLMTYGWAILIIAIVLGVLYYLGVFSSASLAPKAQPGNCQVFRPNGPGTSYDVGLSGTCNGELPEYVAQFNSQAGSYIDGGSGTGLNPTTNVTIVAWVEIMTPTSVGQGIVSKGGAGGNNPFGPYSLWYFQGPPSKIVFEFGNNISRNTNIQVSPDIGVFDMWVAVYTPSTAYLYKNGTLAASTSTGGISSLAVNTNHLFIGKSVGSVGVFNGVIANVQVYNTSLSANEVKALYQEGIGGAPINPTYVVGWWPLNGNPNDYSGNLNQGTATGVTYTSSWTSGYTSP